MNNSFFHIVNSNSDKICFESFLQNGSDNSSDITRMKKIISAAMTDELTDRQRFCIEEYYLGGKKMKDIAKQLGVTPSTVTRHIKLGKQKLKHIARYYM